MGDMPIISIQDQRLFYALHGRSAIADITLLLIEHDMDVDLNVSDRVTVLHEGSIIAEGTPAEISSNELVQQVYLGESLYD